MSDIKFQLLSEDNLALIHQWFQVPHVRKYYANNEDWSFDRVKEYYWPRMSNPGSIPNFIMLMDDHPVGYIQYYLMPQHLPDNWQDRFYKMIALEPAQCIGLDLFIADTDYLGKNYCASIINNFIQQHAPSEIKAVIVDPKTTNKRAVTSFSKTGFKFISHEKETSLMYMRIE